MDLRLSRLQFVALEVRYDDARILRRNWGEGDVGNHVQLCQSLLRGDDGDGVLRRRPLYQYNGGLNLDNYKQCIYQSLDQLMMDLGIHSSMSRLTCLF